MSLERFRRCVRIARDLQVACSANRSPFARSRIPDNDLVRSGVRLATSARDAEVARLFRAPIFRAPRGNSCLRGTCQPLLTVNTRHEVALALQELYSWTHAAVVG